MIVLTESMARKYFSDKPALGKMVELDGTSLYSVCGVVEDFPPQSHWRFTFLASLVSQDIPDAGNWINNTWYTYVLLKEGSSHERAETTFQSIVAEHVRPEIEKMLGGNWREMESKGMWYRYRFQPLTDIHLHSRLDEEIVAPGNMATV